MILLDTNVLSELMRLEPDESVVKNINRVASADVFTSAVTHAEVLQGIAMLDEGKKKQRLRDTANQIFVLFDRRILPFSKKSAPFYADVIQQRTLRGRPIDFPDAQIAAIALQHDLQLFTRNVKDFEKIDNLCVVNPWVA